MGFEQPEVLVEHARDSGEQIRGAGIRQVGGVLDPFANGVSDQGEAVGEFRDERWAVGDRGKLGSWGGQEASRVISSKARMSQASSGRV